MIKNINVVIIFFCAFIIAGCAAAPAPAPAPAQQAPDTFFAQQQAPEQTPREPEPVPQQPDPVPVPRQPDPVRGELVMTNAVIHAVVWMDTLAELSSRSYGIENLYYFPLIRLANANVISDPDLIISGTSIYIPNLQANLDNSGARASLKAEMFSTAELYERRSMPRTAAEIRNLADKL